MIFYDSHKWRTLLRLHGSVFPRAMLAGLPSALLALGVKYLEKENLINLDQLRVLNDGSIYSGLNFVLGFSLVFRTSQSYARYWMAATSVHEMGSEWSDACSSIIAFSRISHRPKEEVQRFAHTIVRLFSLLHAVALEEISSMEDDNFALIDIQGFCKRDLAILATDATQGKKLQVILGWIKVYIIQCMETGLLNVPAPILTRVFQEFGAGLINYHKAQQVVIWPFPFPYTQLNLALLYVYMLFTPMVICIWDVEPWMCMLFTFISVVCMTGLDMIASELENPFGDDPNDLPGMEMQEHYNRGLVLMLNPDAWTPPSLASNACMNYKVLSAQKSHERVPMPLFSTDSLKSRSDKVGKQKSWAQQIHPDSQCRRVHRWLHLTREDIDETEAFTPSERVESDTTPCSKEEGACNLELDVPVVGTCSHAQVSYTLGSCLSHRSESSSKDRGRSGRSAFYEQVAADRLAMQPPGSGPTLVQPWVDFYQAVANDLHENLQRQLQHQEQALQQQLQAQERLIADWAASLRLRSGSDSSDECHGACEEHQVPFGTPKKSRGGVVGGASAETTKRSPRFSASGAEATARRTLLGVARSHEIGKQPLPHPVSRV